MLRRIISSVVALVFLTISVVPSGYSESVQILNLPTPGAMVHLSQPTVPVLLKGMTLHPDDPLRFDFIVDTGSSAFNDAQLRQESDKLVKYFMASMTVPQNDLWVNLSPNEPERIITLDLARTQLGRDLLAQDYILKQLTATLMNPEQELGKLFWNQVREEAQARFGITDVPINTFNKVWIMPQSATVYEHENTVYIVESHLKVMLDEDYHSSDKAVASPSKMDAVNPVTVQLTREIILPAIEKEINQGANFAPLRQIYHSLILAKWYKDTVKNSLLSQVYIDQNKVSGVDDVDEATKNNIYDQYMAAYQKGVYNIMKEEYDAVSQTVIPRRYFSGGFTDSDIEIRSVDNAAMVRSVQRGPQHRLTMAMEIESSDNAMLVPFSTAWYINRLDHPKPKVRLKAAEVIKSRGNFSYANYLLILRALISGTSQGRKKAAEILRHKRENYFYDYFQEELNYVNNNQDPVRQKQAITQIRLVVEVLERLKNTRFSMSEITSEQKIRMVLRASREAKIFMEEGYDFSMEYKPFKIESVLNERLYNSDDMSDHVATTDGGGFVIFKSESDYYENVVTQREDIEVLRGNPLTHEQRQKYGLNADPAQLSDITPIAVGVGMDYERSDPAMLDSVIEIASNYPLMTSFGVVVMGVAGLTAAYQSWSWYTVSGNMYRLRSNDAAVRRVAAEALWRLGATREQMVDGYMKALGRSAGAHEEAARALGELGDTRAVEPLLGLLSDSDVDVRRAAAEELGKLGDERAVEPLLGLLSDRRQGRQRVRYKAAYVLVNLMPEVNRVHKKLKVKTKGASFVGFSDAFLEALSLRISGFDFDVAYTPGKSHEEWYEGNTGLSEEEAGRLNSGYNTDNTGPYSAGDFSEPAGYVTVIDVHESIVISQGTRIDDGLKFDKAMMSDVGGIDMNAINVNRQGAGMAIEFDPQVIDPILNDQIQGFSPVIINITPLPSVLPLLGLKPAPRQDEMVVSSWK